MAKRTYNRDARGRFAGGGGGGGKGGSKGGGGKPAAKAKPASKPASKPATPKAPPKTTTARGRARQVETRARQAVKAGGGSKATRSLLVAQLARDYYKATGSGTKRSRTKAPPQRPTSGIRRTGGLPTVKPASGIRRTTGPRRAPLGGARNAIRTFNPTTPQGKQDQAIRQIGRAAKDLQSSSKKLKQSLEPFKNFKREIDRQTAREIVNAKKKGIDGEIARTILSVTPPRMVRAGQDVIRSRAARARAAADRGSRPAARALEIYGNQLAFTGAGKTPRGAKNKIVPGPRSTQPPAKPKRRAKAKTLGDVTGISTPAAKPPAKPRTAAKSKPAAKSKAVAAAKPKAPAAPAKPKVQERGGAIIKRPSSAIVPVSRPAAPAVRPPAPGKQKISTALRSTLDALKAADARRLKEIEAITGKPVKPPKAPKAPKSGSRPATGTSGRGSVTNALGSNLRQLAQSDARFYRELGDILNPSSSGAIGGSKGGRKGVKGGGSSGALPGSKPKPKRKPRKPKPKA